MQVRRTGLVIASILAPLCAATACRPQPTAAPRPGDPLVLVSPETGPSALQQRLAAMEPARAAAGSDRLDARIDAFFGGLKSRRGYIAVDKPLYQPGETIWFRLFDLASAHFAGSGGGDAAVATIKLISPRGSTAIEKLIAIDGGGGGNDMELASDLAGGEYKLVAETPRGARTERRVIVASYEAPRIKKKLELTRKAYGPGDTVTATVAVHRATGEPLARREVVGLVTLDGADLGRVPVVTDADGNATVTFALPAAIQRGDGLLTVLVDDGGVTESVQKRIPITLKDLQLALYPEGGDLVAGLPARVYFAAKNPLDKPADIEGRVVDDRGRAVALLRSYHDGMGRFELHPDADRRYRVEITRPAGIARTFELPAARASGCAMLAIDDPGSARPELRVALWCTRAQRLAVVAVLREKRVATAAVDVRGGEAAVVALAMPAGVQGAVRVTAFDDQLAPQAERLIYRNRGKDLKITLVADRPIYHPRDAVKLAIETRGPDGAPVAADLAISAVDDTVLAFADDKQATLLARMYLEAELPGQKIEEPNFYFSDDKQAPAALDLVLGTHGWRRFDWKPALSGPPDKPIDDPWRFTGALTPERKQRARPMRKRAAEGNDAVHAAKPANDDAEGDVEEDEAEVDGALHAKRPPRPPVERMVANAAAPPDAQPARDPAPEDKPRHFKAPAKNEARRFDAPRPAAPAQPEAPMADAEEIVVAGAMIVRKELNVFAGEELGEAVVVEGRAPGGRGFGIGRDPDLRAHQIRGAGGDGDDEVAGPPCCAVPEREFAQPSYSGRYDGPRTDFRETVAWRSRLRTDAAGKGEISFFLSDAVTSFKVVAEGAGGGRLGRGEALVQSKKPVSLAVKLPLEVSAGDHVRLPVTIANETDQPYRATLAATFGKAFTVTGGALAPELRLAPGERRSTFYELDVTGDGRDASDGRIAITVDAANLRDTVERTVRVVPAGFPQQVSLAGTLSGTVRHDVVITDVLPGTLRGMLTMYPSPLATMVRGTEAMIAEPGGCFEQASSTNYPNIMILSYLEENGAAAPAIVERAQGALDRGYKLLTGYETPSKGYEWFGSNPGHEALTAYGLMEFRDMAKVYGDVDRAMIDRTRDWLRGRRDGKGGFLRNPQQLDSFGGASPEVTDAYITYALSEAGERDLTAELDKQRRSAAVTRDPYLLALATKVLIAQAPSDDATRGAVGRLAAMQAADGSFPGADHSITRSGGEALAIETTSLAALALIAAGGQAPETRTAIRNAINWLDKHRNGSGGYGSTQSTVLALKAMAAYAKDSRRTQASGTVTLVVNGAEVGKLAYDKGHQGALELPIARHLRPGKNTIEIALDSTAPLPYSALVEWSSKVPASDPATAVRMTTRLARPTVKLGETARVDVEVRNASDRGIPMTLARVGLPGGLTFQTWQLQELRDKRLIDFYETRPREVILYFRSLAPGAVKDVPLELMATVPGTFTSPASRAYLYYTDERKHWVAPSTVTIAP
jgi:hypothetical protein